MHSVYAERKESLSEDKVQMKSPKVGTGEEESSKKSATSLILFEEVQFNSGLTSVHNLLLSL